MRCLAAFNACLNLMGIGSPKHFASYTLVGLSLGSTLCYAQSEWASCPLPSLPVEQVARPDQLPPEAVYIEADSAAFREQGVSEMTGNVYISQKDVKLRADQASYEQPAGVIKSQGNVNFRNDKLNVNSQTLHYNLPQQQGEMQQAEYYINGADGHGKSDKVVQTTSNETQLENSSYTTCAPTANDWNLSAKKIKLDHTKQRGTAKDVTLNIKDVPVFYFPYLSFPLTNERQSGFLWPNIGTSSKSGVQVSTPYYFNLAPNYDLTLTPTFIGRRGLQLGSEFRFLTEDSKGSLKYVVLPDDRVSDVNNRYYFNVQDDTQLNDHASISVRAEGVSDNDYFTDLGNSLAATSTVNLERRFEYRQNGEDWAFKGVLQNYQVLDGSTKPHSKLPQLTFRYHPLKKGNGVNFDVETEYTHFTGSDTETNGSRLDVATRASKKFSGYNNAVYVKPSITVRHTEYALDDGDDTHLQRTVPTASVDSGMVFERPIRSGKYTQTLEPRLFYTYTPYRDQSAIPVFDSSERSLSYSQLFAENRYNGKDRIGDNNRLTASVTTRVQSPKDGSELFRASVGQMYYFADRKVTLPDETALTGRRSELVMEAAGDINARTNVSSTAYWDTSEEQFNAGEVRVRYKDPKQRILNVGYAQRKSDFESANVAFSVPVKAGWKAVGAVEQDLLNNRNLETVVGAEYETCCWKTRIASRNYLQTDNETRDNAVYLELELKGLGNFGSSTSDLLKDRIRGYE